MLEGRSIGRGAETNGKYGKRDELKGLSKGGFGERRIDSERKGLKRPVAKDLKEETIRKIQGGL